MKLSSLDGQRQSRRNSIDTVSEQEQLPCTSTPCLQTLSSPKASDLPRPFRFLPVWQRVRSKLRVRLYLQRLEQEINLFGASTLPLPDDTNTDTLLQLQRKLHQSEQINDLVPLRPVSQSLFLLHPNATGRLIWSGVYVCLMLYTVIVSPYSMAFLDTSQNHFEWIDLTVDALFFVDILVTFNTAFYDNEGKLRVSRPEIAIRYVKTWFVLDLVSCFPIYYIFQDDSTETSNYHYNSLLRLTRLPKFYRLWRMSRVYKLLVFRENRVLELLRELICEKTTVLQAIAFILFVLTAIHLMACCWFLVARVEGLGPESWVGRRELGDADTVVLYIASLQWALTTLATVGYGDIAPGTTLERLIACIWVTFGMVIVSLSISSITIYLFHRDAKEVAILNKLQVITDFATSNDLDPSIQRRLRQAIRFNVTQNTFSLLDKRELFTELPRDLKYEVALSMHNHAIKSIPFFMQRDQVFISSIVPFLQSTYVAAGAWVYREKEYAEEIYFIAEGRCGLMANEVHVLKKLQQGAYFGEVEVLTPAYRQFAVKTIAESTLLTLKKRLLNVIKTDFPKVYEEMKEIARIRKQLNETARKRYLRWMKAMKPLNRRNGRSVEPVFTPNRLRRRSPTVMPLIPLHKLDLPGKVVALKRRIRELEPVISSTQAQLLTIEKIVQERL